MSDLPHAAQKSVETIKRHCAAIWSENFEMRLYCEDSEYSKN
jgi:hypothetical protein